MTPLIVVTHIEKTSGTSFVKEVVIPNLPEGSVVECAGVRHCLAALRGSPRAIAGHTPFGIHRFTRRPCRYVTFLRDPIDRAISHYHFVRGAKIGTYEHPWCAHANAVGVVEFFRTTPLANRQTRLLAGMAGDVLARRVPPRALERWLLDAALAHLERDYACVGFQERYEESVALAQRLFGWSERRSGPPHKPTRGRPRLEEVDPATLAALRELHHLDLQLHERAQARFEALRGAPPLVARGGVQWSQEN